MLNISSNKICYDYAKIHNVSRMTKIIIPNESATYIPILRIGHEPMACNFPSEALLCHICTF